MSTEEKLNALVDINKKVFKVEHILNSISEQHLMVHSLIPLPIPGELSASITRQVRAHFEFEKTQLIQQAEELMKTEAHHQPGLK